MAFENLDDPTALSFTEYADLDLEAREMLVNAVYEQYKDKIYSLLGQTATWVLVCGPDCEVVQVAETTQDILTDTEIWEKAMEIGYAPFHFFQDEIIEDLTVV